MTHLTDWQRGYQAGVLQGRTRESIKAGERLLWQTRFLMAGLTIGIGVLLTMDEPWQAAILTVLLVIVSRTHWGIIRGVERLRTYVKEDL